MRRPSRDGADEYAEPNGVRGQLQTPRVDDLAIASSRLRRQVLDCTMMGKDAKQRKNENPGYKQAKGSSRNNKYQAKA